jgi:hypothetical protein
MPFDGRQRFVRYGDSIHLHGVSYGGRIERIFADRCYEIWKKHPGGYGSGQGAGYRWCYSPVLLWLVKVEKTGETLDQVEMLDEWTPGRYWKRALAAAIEECGHLVRELG